ncbi:MAG: FAD-dependent oxidoreductase [Candidatus Fermentibacteraceae bacterium]|nr:FAD-dependent oxidoreductase [Candidatus Fermentibacteraceae bacterium]MBN2608550.1 FAD-dependent oxidoreductase [Candidatus Fermentibacteraceae bacterium]
MEDNTVRLVIDDNQVQCQKGTTLLQACRRLDIDIPTLCYHQSLSPYGSCRLCLVEVEQNGRTSIQTSCNYPVQEGLTVRTSTDRVIRTRKLMVELLLARCPDSREIMRLASEMGVTGERIEPKNEDCILCGLCVRMCRERMGRGVLGFSNRGSRRIVSPAFDELSEECRTCGACFSICPVENGIKLEKITGNVPLPIRSEFDEGLVDRSAVYIPYAQAVPNYASIDPRYCVHLNTGDCGICSEYCEADAIDFDQVEVTSDIGVGAVILTTGAEPFDPTPLHEFGYGRYPNVLTSIQFERILAASGPFEGHLQRPSDGRVPTRIAWLQCVGSRTEDSHMPYCSSVCCMYAMKEAIIAREHVGTVEPTIFFMDLRAHGKDFDRYYERAKETGIRFQRSRVSKVREIRETGNLEIRYVTEDGTVCLEEFDLVVLSVGLAPGDGNGILSDRLGLRLNEYGFIGGSSESPVGTTRNGVFVCGPAGSPMDIPETVIQASGAVAGAAELLSAARGTEIEQKRYPPELDVRGKRPRIGVFVCHCGTNIGSIVDVPDVAEYARNLPDVVYAGENLFTCSQDTQEKMKELIEEYRLNRVVVSSCSPSTHEPLFQETIREAGLNPYLFNMANIRNQCSWVHRNDPAEATRKAKILTRIAVGKARLLKPLHTVALDVIQKGLVIGGGLAGMTAALSIADQGFQVALVERESSLGGNLHRLSRKPDGHVVSEYLEELTARVENHPGITVHTGSCITGIDGYIGNYLTSICKADTDTPVEYEHGVIVIATGAEETVPDSYLYGESGGKVLTQLDLEKDLEENGQAFAKLGTVVMIQCVGSRDDEHPYCSRVCCTQAVKNSLRLKELNPSMNVFVLYRDVRTYGFNEKYYQQARSKGVIFVRYDEDEKPEAALASADPGSVITVRVRDHVLGSILEIKADRVILASAMKPREDASLLSQMLKIPLNEDGFFMEAHVKLRPVDFSAEGIFLAGLAHSPKTMDETVSQARAAAERACIIISSDKYMSVANIASVNPDVCAGCGMCVSVCPYSAPGLVWKGGRQVCSINTALCKGCGSCSTVCPSGAMEQLGFSEEQTLEMVNFSLINL